MKEFSSKKIALKVDITGPENVLLAGESIYASFSREILQAGAVEGLNNS